jgi:ribosome biogenesis GTPase / thiamine phosphate phosphatase
VLFRPIHGRFISSSPPVTGGRLPSPAPGGEPGTVLEGVGGIYRVRLDRGPEVEAFLRGRLKREARTGEKVVAGDRVRVAPAGEAEWTVEKVEERVSQLVRAGPRGRRPKVVAANLDRIVIVLSALDPPFRRQVADRFLVLAESCRIPPVMVVNKMDLPGARDEAAPHLEVLREAGYPVLETSARTEEGLEALREATVGRTSALVGPSGVGKSTLLNAMESGLELRTGEVSRKARRGRHTTVSARLLHLRQGIRVVDTPGFADVAAWGIAREELARAFPEFEEPADRCRFRGCSHLHEPGCGVREAVEEGVVHPWRYDSYRELMEG